MAKRRSEDILNSPPAKKYHHGLYNVDMRLESMASFGGVSPPSLCALLGSRRRKRPFYFEETEEQDLDLELCRKSTHSDLMMKRAGNVTSMQQTSGNFQEQRLSTNVTLTNSSKRDREDCGAPADTANPKAKVDAADATDTENSTYNSFQFWKIPLPELDLSLLQDPSQKDSSSDAMET